MVLIRVIDRLTHGLLDVYLARAMESGKRLEGAVQPALQACGGSYVLFETQHAHDEAAAPAIQAWVHTSDEVFAGEHGHRVVTEPAFVGRDVDLPDIGEVEEIGKPLAPSLKDALPLRSWRRIRSMSSASAKYGRRTPLISSGTTVPSLR